MLDAYTDYWAGISDSEKLVNGQFLSEISGTKANITPIYQPSATEQSSLEVQKLRG